MVFFLIMSVLLYLCVFAAFAIFSSSSALPEPPRGGQNWAVLVAGENHWQALGYSVQADVCHAYQVLRRNGIPDSNIIVMMYDNVAYDPENPTPGVIRNRKGGPNVYENVLKDYTGEDVTPENFLNVLSGDKEAMQGIGSEKVLESGPNDNVFVMFAGHGGAGLSVFPSKHFLYSHKLIKVLKKIHSEKRFNKMLIYWMSCFSGSMFHELLPENINILAITAANWREFAKATVLDSETHTYDGSQFNLAWMGDVERNQALGINENESVGQQYLNIKKAVKGSHPQVYGQFAMKKDLVRDYIGYSDDPFDKPYLTLYEDIEHEDEDTVSMEDAALKTLELKISKAQTEEEMILLEGKRTELLENRARMDKLMDEVIASVLTSSRRTELASQFEDKQAYIPLRLETFPCYETLVESFSTSCVSTHSNTYALRHMWKLANLCSLNFPVESVLEIFTNRCTD